MKYDFILNGATITFELDGTLVDSTPDLIDAVNAALMAGKLDPLQHAKARPVISRGARSLLQYSLTRASGRYPAGHAVVLFGHFLEYYSERLADRTRLFPGAVATFRTLKTGYKAGVLHQQADLPFAGPANEALYRGLIRRYAGPRRSLSVQAQPSSPRCSSRRRQWGPSSCNRGRRLSD